MPALPAWRNDDIESVPVADLDPLPAWRDGQAKQSIIDFVEAVTAVGSTEFVPESDRVAVFDNDGTLWSELPMYAQLMFAIDRAAELGQPVDVDALKAGGVGAVLELVKLTHGNVSTQEFDEACKDWIAAAIHPRFGRSYTATVYQPMLELLACLDGNNFSCWIFSGGGVDFMRAWATGVYGIPAHRLIGSVGSTEFRLGDHGPELIKGTDLQILNDGPQKPVSIHSHIGQRPILAAGNTDGDLPMLQWTAASPYRTLELAIHHTDAEREYAYDTDPLLGSGTGGLLAAAADNHWTVVDMVSDWSEIFPPAS
jgi:haloacid dehalogenase-like hydrolase